MTIYQYDQHSPQIDSTAYVAPEAVVIGRVELGAYSSIWPCAVLRGDNELISLGEGSNAQDGAILHTDPGHPCQVGKNVTIGHQAMLHGCTVEDGSLIGIQAVVLNGAVIGKESLVGAGALVTEGKVFPPRSLILGSPARRVRELTDEEVKGLQRNTNVYRERAVDYKEKLKPL